MYAYSCIKDLPAWAQEHFAQLLNTVSLYTTAFCYYFYVVNSVPMDKRDKGWLSLSSHSNPVPPLFALFNFWYLLCGSQCCLTARRSWVWIPFYVELTCFSRACAGFLLVLLFSPPSKPLTEALAQNVELGALNWLATAPSGWVKCSKPVLLYCLLLFFSFFCFFCTSVISCSMSFHQLALSHL